LRLEAGDVAHGGYCVARWSGRVVFVSGTLPGEVVRAAITGQRSRQWYARTIEVLQASPDRRAPVWPLAASNGLGGADLGHVSLAAGRTWKAAVIAGQLRRIAHLVWPVTVRSAPGDDGRDGLAWRTRLTLLADAEGRLAMRAAKSHQLLAIDGFPLAHETIQRRLADDLVRRWSPGWQRGYTLAAESGLATFDRPADQPAPDTVDVRESVTLPDGRWHYRVAADGFWQVHRQAPAVLVAGVLGAVDQTAGPIYDLYAGAGLLTLPLAERGPVVAVERSESAVRSLRANAADRPVTVCSGDVAAVLAGLAPTRGGTIVADPPRAGAGQAVIDRIVERQPDQVVYVACDPAALARDAGLLLARGFDLVDLQGFDLFPYTHHVEAVAVFRPAAGTATGGRRAGR